MLTDNGIGVNKDHMTTPGQFTLHSQNLGSLPIVNFFLARIGLADHLRNYLPHDDARLRLAPAAVVEVVVRNLVAGHRPVYALGEWAAPPVVAWTIALARRAEVSSLLDHSPQRWHELAGSKQGMYQRFLEYARDAIEMLHEGTSWEVEYPRDVWRLHRLPGLTLNAGKPPHSRINLRFDRFTQPWLRTLAKRWARLRLSSGLTVSTVLCDIQGLTRFSAFLAEAAPDVEALAGIDRAVLERYLAWLITSSLGHGARKDAVKAPTTFFQAIRQHGWDDTLAATALFFPGDIPARPPRLTRHLAEYVMAQVEAPRTSTAGSPLRGG